MQDDYVLLRQLKRQLAYLGSPGSEAQLHMASWPNCIVGYAIRMPVFNALGLYFDNGVPAFGPRRGMEAAEAFFGLTERQADYLFADNPQLTGFDVVQSFAEACRRIDDIVIREEI